ncbi:hypothetical protein AB2N08_18665 [Massilia aurea]|uniref:hypothetical protein n=1 Tax=Massilia aurea TaxID=373040 RepID=UPI003461F2AA
MGVMQILRPAALGAALIFVLSSSLAAPAPYYQYRSKLTGELACSPTPLGEGWVRSNGPYRDARCEKRIVVK